SNAMRTCIMSSMSCFSVMILHSTILPRNLPPLGATEVPSPTRAVSTPTMLRQRSASRSEDRPALKFLQSSLSDGSRCPGLRSPLAISASIWSTISSLIDVLSTGRIFEFSGETLDIWDFFGMLFIYLAKSSLTIQKKHIHGEDSFLPNAGSDG